MRVLGLKVEDSKILTALRVGLKGLWFLGCIFEGLLRDSRVVIRRTIRRITIITAGIWRLITPLITTHEPRG